MNPKLKKFLVICAYVALICAALAAIFLSFYLLDVIVDMLYEYLLAKTSSEALAFFGLLAVLLAALPVGLGIHILCSALTDRITSNYESFKNNNNNSFSEVYNDPTVRIKDKILFFHISLIYYIQSPLLWCSSKIQFVTAGFARGDVRAAILPLLINVILLIPVIILELIKYPLIKLFSPLGLNVHQLSFLFNVSDVGTGSQNVHTRSFEESIVRCARELKIKYRNQLNELGQEFNELDREFNELDREFKDFISGLTNQQKSMIAPYLKLDGYREGPWVNWMDSKTGLTLTQAINLVLIAAREQGADRELLKSILLVRFEESNRQCGPGMLNRIIYALSGLEARNNFVAQLEPQMIGELAGNSTKRFLERYICKHYQKIKILKENFDDLYSLNSGVDLSNASDEIRDGVSYTRNAIKEFVFRELYVKFYNDYGEHIKRGEIKQKLKELITDAVIDAAIYAKIDEINISEEPPTYLEKVKEFVANHVRFAAV